MTSSEVEESQVPSSVEMNGDVLSGVAGSLIDCGCMALVVEESSAWPNPPSNST